jgi:hypothetical protein
MRILKKTLGVRIRIHPYLFEHKNLLIKMNIVLAVAECVVFPREELEAALFAALTTLPAAAAAEEAEREQDASC